MHEWRRSYDIPPPSGESLEMCSQRAVAYFKDCVRTSIFFLPNIKIPFLNYFEMSIGIILLWELILRSMHCRSNPNLKLESM